MTHHRLALTWVAGLALAGASCAERPADLATPEENTAAVSATELGIWVPRATLALEEAVRGREALAAAGVQVLLVLPGHVVVTTSALESPDNTSYERLDPSGGWSVRATAVQAASTALARRLLRPSAAPSRRDFIDDVFQVESQLDAARRELEASRATTHDPRSLRAIDADLATLDGEARALTAAPIVGTPPESRRKYLRGSILVQALFVESTGVGNEDWTDAEVDAQLTDFAAALLRLARVAPVEYQLSFELDHIRPSDPRMRISDEPTDGVPERRWIVQVLRNLGYGGVVTAAGGTQRYERDVIASHGAREGTVVYVARDAVAPFADFNNYDRTAWPHAGFNSYAVTNGSEGGDVLVHELLHTFNAEDEYSDPQRFNYGCVARSNIGHARAVAAGSGPNSNANQVDCDPAAEHQDCIMESEGSRAIDPFARPILCWHTRAQIGWRDTASVRVNLTGLPSTSATAFDPSLITHIDTRAVAGAGTFSYVESGGFFFGGRRCTQQVSTQQRFTATGDVINCPLMSFATGTVDGRPDDIRVNTTDDEGRVHVFSVPYSATQAVACGDGVCDLTETAASCAADCGCGNGSCDTDESLVSCPADCAFCGDDACSPGETRFNYPVDCCTTCL